MHDDYVIATALGVLHLQTVIPEIKNKEKPLMAQFYEMKKRKYHMERDGDMDIFEDLGESEFGGLSGY